MTLEKERGGANVDKSLIGKEKSLSRKGEERNKGTLLKRRWSQKGTSPKAYSLHLQTGNWGEEN